MMRCIAILIALLSFIVPATAFANPYYDVCGTAYFWEDRSDVSDGYGSKLPNNRDTNQRFPGQLRVELWDQDGDCADFVCQEPEGDDDLLAVAFTTAYGTYCFEDIHASQDIYVSTPYSTQVGLMQAPRYPGSVSPRFGTHPTVFDFGVEGLSSSTFWLDFNITCWDETKNDEDAKCDGDGDVETYFNSAESYSNILRSVVDVDHEVSDADLTLNGHSNKFNVHFPQGPDGQCSSIAAKSWGYDDICISTGYELENHKVAHELGHAIHRRALDHGSGLGNCGRGGSGHDWGSSEWEKCATAEGWANFFAGAVYFHDYASDPWLMFSSWNLEGNTQIGNNYGDRCVGYHEIDPWVPHYKEGNVARFFWDLYDSTEENESGSGSCSGSCDDCNGGFDNQNYTLSKLINDWDDFQAGSCNRRASETGVDGRNVWDYQHYKPWACSEIHLNCLDDQYEGGPCCGC